MSKTQAEKRDRILEVIRTHPNISSKEIHERLLGQFGYATIKRRLQRLLEDKFVAITGKGKATRYRISDALEILYPIDIDVYFSKEIDDREIKRRFNHSIFDLLNGLQLFTDAEMRRLTDLQQTYEQNIASLSGEELKKEIDRLTIDLSWKSSQIEGNTYSLLETERLLKEKETAAGKQRDEATMLLNHKTALDFVFDNPQQLKHLSLARIEEIHSLLIKDLNVARNIRVRRVGISGTNYLPLENEFQIREALEKACVLINNTQNVFSKALLVLVIFSYIQAFSDGNKRTARILSNAILISHHHCPLSFRTVDPIAYKKAMLLFYEQNNMVAMKRLFIDQFEFAVDTYF